jgi:hypothetical protein
MKRTRGRLALLLLALTAAPIAGCLGGQTGQPDSLTCDVPCAASTAGTSGTSGEVDANATAGAGGEAGAAGAGESE